MPARSTRASLRQSGLHRASEEILPATAFKAAS